jgi:hypothetical protein
MHTYFFIFSTFFDFSVFLFFYFFIFLFFIFYFFFGLGPTQPTWAGLNPASPARSLAQASDPAGKKSKKARVHEQNRGNELECVN